MRQRRTWSRRAVLGSALVGATLGGRAEAQEAGPSDRGIGGTGMVPTDPVGEDRGIGGTGVIGTIRRFGSIVVNGLRITFPRSVRVRIDGRRAHLRDLEIGHVVHVLAQGRDNRLETRTIDVFSEVVGPVEAVTDHGFMVLGQSVAVADGFRRAWPVGRWVAVSGLRRLDGVIVASRIGRGRQGAAQVAGVPRREPDGTMRIEGLPIHGLDEGTAGQRIRVTGRLRDGSLHFDRASAPWSDLLAARPAHLSIEDYVASDRGTVRLGSGLPVSGETRVDLAAEGSRAILTATVAHDGAVRVDHVHTDAGAPARASGPEPRGPDRPDAHRPGAIPDAAHGPPADHPAREGVGPGDRGSFNPRSQSGPLGEAHGPEGGAGMGRGGGPGGGGHGGGPGGSRR